MTIQLPALDNNQFEVSDTTWQALTDEITSLKSKIDTGVELHPSDVQNVRSLVKQVRDYGVLYRRAITKQSNDYKAKLDEELDKLGYRTIDDYINQKRQEQNRAIEQRLSDKLNQFNQLVDGDLSETEYLKQSSISNFVANNLASRFPKLNSGATNKEIKSWEPVKAVIEMSISNAEKQFIEYPILLKLPATSQSLRAISDYLKTGDNHKLENLSDVIQSDRPILEQEALKAQVKTTDSALDLINSVVTSDVEGPTKIKQIQTLLNAYYANQR